MECGIINFIHRQLIYDAIRGENDIYDYLDNNPLDSFISYRLLANLHKGNEKIK